MLVEIEAVEETRILRMNQGENRFNQPFVSEMMAALATIESDPRARAVVLTGGEEKFFSNGLDLNWLVTQKKEAILESLLLANEFLLRVLTFPRPVVAAINGHAFAGGLLLALTADYRIMREDRGWCCFPEVELGIDFPPGSVALVQWVVGHRQADALVLSGRKLNGPQALAIGLVDELASRENLLPRALEIARDLGRIKSSRQYPNLKRALRDRLSRIMAEEDPAYIKAKLGGGEEKEVGG